MENEKNVLLSFFHISFLFRCPFPKKECTNVHKGQGDLKMKVTNEAFELASGSIHHQEMRILIFSSMNDGLTFNVHNTQISTHLKSCMANTHI